MIVDLLEAPFKRGVLLDVLAVLLERRRADALELAARERGLEQVRRVDGALRRPGADERVPRCERAARACKKIDFLSADFRINLTRLVLGCIKAVANRYSFAA